MAALSYVGGFVVSKILKDLKCEFCVELMSRSKCSSILMDLICKRDDDGKLNYPSDLLLWIMKTIQDFVEKASAYVSCNISETLTATILPILSNSPSMTCSQDGHSKALSTIICETVVPLYLKNIATTTSERFERVKYLNSKPQNRKVLRV